MQESGISRRDYERLPIEVKLRTAEVFEKLKHEFRDLGFSLKFLSLKGRWEDLTSAEFLALPSTHYERLITSSKWVRPRRKQDLIDQISEIYQLVRRAPKLTEIGLEHWL